MLAITLDDGYADNLWNALPLLKERGIPAALFVASSFIDSSGRFWRDQLVRTIAANGSRTLTFDTGNGMKSFPFTGRFDKQAQTAARWLESLPMEQRDDLLGDEHRNEADRFLTHDELLHMESNGVRIEAHSVSHARLSALERSEMVGELTESKAILQEILGRPVRFLAYPFGERNDFNDVTKEVARDAGYDAAFAAYRGVVNENTDMFAAPRIPTHEDLSRFKMRLARY
jgi:peptidoglycan/xylan/chitin deacetylase (PgdA/CDA1 family)